MRIVASDRGARFVFRQCGFTRGFVMTGTGSADYGDGEFVLDVRVTGRFAG
jgi:hypothetical protein